MRKQRNQKRQKRAKRRNLQRSVVGGSLLRRVVQTRRKRLFRRRWSLGLQLLIAPYMNENLWWKGWLRRLRKIPLESFALRRVVAHH